MKTVKTLFLVLFSAFFVLLNSCTVKANVKKSNVIPAPKNIIILIGDGMGFNQVLATNFYEHGVAKAQPYEQEGWTILAHATYPAMTHNSETEKHFSHGYNPRLAWTDPENLRRGATDSGAGGTALSTGVKTYNNSIGIGINGDTLIHVSQIAKQLGKSVGIVSSVQMSHATPASFSAHNSERRNYQEIAKYMFFNTKLDLIMAAGHPDFDDDGKPSENNDRYVGGRELWYQLAANEGKTEFEVDGINYKVLDANGDGNPDAWTVVQTRDEIVALANGKTPSRVLGIPQVNSTLHFGRTKPDGESIPFSTPLNKNVPTLEELTKASLNILGQNKKGFFVMIEGGAIDWACHDNNLVRTIEEQIDFNNSIKAAIQWVEKNSSWDETLIIITADHETGYLTGPKFPEEISSRVENQGKGNLPIHKFNSGSHTNSLVPIFAKGPGLELLRLLAGENDPIIGKYMQNVQIPQAIFLMWGGNKKE
jgi:alkaline phosphatase